MSGAHQTWGVALPATKPPKYNKLDPQISVPKMEVKTQLGTQFSN